MFSQVGADVQQSFTSVNRDEVDLQDHHHGACPYVQGIWFSARHWDKRALSFPSGQTSSFQYFARKRFKGDVVWRSLAFDYLLTAIYLSSVQKSWGFPLETTFLSTKGGGNAHRRRQLDKMWLTETVQCFLTPVEKCAIFQEKEARTFFPRLKTRASLLIPTQNSKTAERLLVVTTMQGLWRHKRPVAFLPVDGISCSYLVGLVFWSHWKTALHCVFCP